MAQKDKQLTVKMKFPDKREYLQNASWFVKVAYYTGMGYFKKDAKLYGKGHFERTFKCRWWHPLYWCFGIVLLSLKILVILLEEIIKYMKQSVKLSVDK